MITRPVSKEFKISSPFGDRVHPITGEPSFHKGIDFSCPEGSEVVAPLDCEIVLIEKRKNAGLMLTVIAECDDCNFFFNFFHLSSIIYNVGDEVKEGDKIALSGNTGRSSGPHLHFEVWENTAYRPRDVRNPCVYLEEEDGIC